MEVKLSPEFKSQSTKAILSITLFVITYFILLIIAIGLTALSVYGGLMLIVSFPRFLTIVLGIGLASLGFLILIFLLKFMFTKHKVERSNMVEIIRKDEPKLFKLIDQIVQDVQTTFPKKVYLTSDVNASVFYDSSFWSMFLPIRKNLQIGMGLVNTVTRSELKAILSHEFGHFSQRSMKVGSYVYNVNQVIFNMLFDNESYERLIQKWASISGYFSIFVAIAVQIIAVVQWILRQLYEVVNKSYMALSREMEFHADEIAASVTGYEPLKSSLLRLSLADYSFNSVMSFYEQKFNDNICTQNIYPQQYYVMQELARESELPIKESFPVVTVDDLNKFNKSKLVVKDQWASHPSTEDRIARLEATNLRAEDLDNLPAETIFLSLEDRQRLLTRKLFENVKYQDKVEFIDQSTFANHYQEEVEKNSFPKIYNGYYDDKNPIKFDFQETGNVKNEGIKELFSDKMVEFVYEIISLQNDIEFLKQVADKSIPIKTFDYDGKKYNRKEASQLITRLNVDLDEKTEQIRMNDIKIYSFFNALDKSDRLESLYAVFFEYDEKFDKNQDIYGRMNEALQFISYTLPYEEIRKKFSEFELLEFELKDKIRNLLEDSLYEPEITDAMRSNFDEYLSRNWSYFGNESYKEDNLEMLFNALNNYIFLLSRGYFVKKQVILNYQASLLENSTIQSN